MEQYVQILSVGMHLFILVDISCVYIMHVFNISICVNELIFSFLPFNQF